MEVNGYRIIVKPVNNYSKYSTFNQIIVKKGDKCVKVFNYRKAKEEEKLIEVKKYCENLC